MDDLSWLHGRADGCSQLSVREIQWVLSVGSMGEAVGALGWWYGSQWVLSVVWESK